MEAVVTPFTIFVIAIVVVVVLFSIMAVKSLPQGYELTVERFGRFTCSLRPGPLEVGEPVMLQVSTRADERLVGVDRQMRDRTLGCDEL